MNKGDFHVDGDLTSLFMTGVSPNLEKKNEKEKVVSISKCKKATNVPKEISVNS